VRRNLQYVSLLAVVSATSEPPFQLLSHRRLSNVERISRPNCEPIYVTNTSHGKQKTFLYDILFIVFFYPQKERTIEHCSSVVHTKHGRYFEYWNQPLSIRMCICYIDSQEAGLCCYLVIHIENLLRPLRLFYFHLWPIYWLCFVISRRTQMRHWRCSKKNKNPIHARRLCAYSCT
jgi:hypothetical protein